jgi:biotin transport system substrate-specific component
MVLGTILCYTIGTAWFVYQSVNAKSAQLILQQQRPESAWGAALAVCVAPFLPFDAVKIVAASVISPVIRARFGQYIYDGQT